MRDGDFTSHFFASSQTEERKVKSDFRSLKIIQRYTLHRAISWTVYSSKYICKCNHHTNINEHERTNTNQNMKIDAFREMNRNRIYRAGRRKTQTRKPNKLILLYK